MISANAVMTSSYDYGEVARSILIAIAGSYAALDLAGRVTVASGPARSRWLGGGALAMGIGIWEMHFKGMLALRLSVPVAYHWPTVLLSFVVAVITSGIALRIVSRPKMSALDLWTGSLIMGGGIAALHYLDMAAMRLAAVCRFDLRIVILSILFAIGFSFAALTLAFGLREETGGTPWRRIASALVIGAAISAMHYTGMASARFIASPVVPNLSQTVNISPLANGGLAMITLLVLGAAIVTSIEDRKRAEDELRKQKEVFQKIFEDIPVMIGFVSKHGRIELVNPEWERTMAWTLAEIQEPNKDVFADLFPDPEYRQWVRNSIAASTGQWTDFRVRVRDGRLIDVAAAFVRLSDGSSLGIGKDITEWKQTQAALQEAQENLTRVTRAVAMGGLAATIAHEVNQPLAAIVTNSNFCLRELSGEGKNPERLREAIAEIVNDGVRASAIISRIRALLAKGSPDTTELDMNEMIQGVTGLLRNELTRNRVSVRTDLDSDLPRVSGDRVQLQQVLINLAMNSTEAMHSLTSRPRELLIKSRRYNTEVLIQVQDSGEGLSSQQAQHIFEPFFTTKPEGIGMGLTISRSIIESHGGRLWAESNHDGALFQFTLPTSSNGIS
jgi:PAS domain S-box-containing protein